MDLLALADPTNWRVDAGRHPLGLSYRGGQNSHTSLHFTRVKQSLGVSHSGGTEIRQERV